MFGFLISVLIGATAGWLAGLIMKGGGFGMLPNILIGIIGGFIGGQIFYLIGLIATGIIARLFAATLGAVILIYVVDIIRRRA